MLIQILGTGCAKCNQLKENVEAAVRDVGQEARIEKVEDIMQITGFGVMTTPGLVIDGEVKATGKVLSVEEIKGMLE